MGTKLTEEAYKKLVKEDIIRLEKEMKHSPERSHIKAVLECSIEWSYPKKNKYHGN